MKIKFLIPDDSQRHRFCINCNTEYPKEVTSAFHCERCGRDSDRVIDIDPQVVYWVDPKTLEYWHESVGVFVINKNQEILLIERTLYPVGLCTIPAGHLDINEIPKEGAIRELFEETGIVTTEISLIVDLPMTDDSCRRGSDCHLWHLYRYRLEESVQIKVDQGEGKNPIWTTRENALQMKLTSPVKYFLEHYSDQIFDH
jgi:ADP-ribose pyrophosphatase YjhB (NUDIX family)